ncbi:MAG: hypothetical protein RL670_1126 [Actinomycetota bacterium]
MSDEQQAFDSGQPLTRRQLRAMQRQQNTFGDAETAESASEAETSSAAETAFTPVPEPVIEPAPTPPPVAPVFNQEFKFVAPSLATEEAPVDTGFQAPYRYVPGGATTSANQVDFPEVPVASPSLGEPPSVVTEFVSTSAAPESTVEITPEAPEVPPTSSFVSQPVVETPQPTQVAETEPTPAAVKGQEDDVNDGTDGLFRIPSNLTGEVATASIVIENSTNPLDIIAGTSPGTGSIPIVRTGSIDIQNPEARPAAATTGSIRTQPSTDTSPSTAIITPLKSQTIALTGELGHQRGVRFKPIDPQKYWVLGIGVLMVVVGVGFLASFLLGYVK